MKTLAALVVFISLPALAQPRSTATLDRLCGGYEHAPSAAEVRALGPGADQALIDYATAASTSPLRRQRAIAALAFVPSVAAHQLLVAVLSAEGRASRGIAVLDVAAALSALTPYGAPALATVLPYLTHPSADVRQAAANTLGALGLPSAGGALEARLAVERDPSVRVHLAAALARLRAR
ncbi:MAG: HEAT repeat domain-containing protein [Polyangia bacterium]